MLNMIRKTNGELCDCQVRLNYAENSGDTILTPIVVLVISPGNHGCLKKLWTMPIRKSGRGR